MSRVTYKDFISNASSIVNEKLNNFSEFKNAGKIYEDEIISLFQGSEITITYLCKDTDEKRLNIITNILQNTHIIDNELYNFVRDMRDKIIVNKPQVDNNFAKDVKISIYADWTNRTKEFIHNNQEIYDFVGKRTTEHFKRRDQEYIDGIEYFENNLKNIKTILNFLHGNNRDTKELKRHYEIMSDEYYHYNIAYENWKDSYQKNIITFRSNLISLIEEYVFSKGKAEENLKKSYIKLFLWNKINLITFFSYSHEYSLSLGKYSDIVQTKSSAELFDNFLIKYKKIIENPHIKKTKYKQLRLDI